MRRQRPIKIQSGAAARVAFGRADEALGESTKVNEY
jgi:hypothetical protein